MKALITGGAGYIGSVTSELLLDKGHRVVVFDNLERGHKEAIDGRAAFVKGDLRDSDAISGVVKDFMPDAVLHFAAYALVGESMQQPGMYFSNNVGGGQNLVEAMAKEGVPKIVFSSTCATYGDPGGIPITEEMIQDPANPYGESKLMLERILSWYNRLCGIEPVFLRYFNACGATGQFGEDHYPETHLIPNVLAVAAGEKERVQIFGDDYDTPDGTCIRDYIHVSDLAMAHLNALERKVTGAFNLGSGRGYSVNEVVSTAREVTGRDIPACIAPRRPGDPARLVAGNNKARNELDWDLHHSDLKSIIESAWLWLQEYPGGYGCKEQHA